MFLFLFKQKCPFTILFLVVVHFEVHSVMYFVVLQRNVVLVLVAKKRKRGDYIGVGIRVKGERGSGGTGRQQ